MNKFLTKKNILFIGLGGAIILLSVVLIMTTEICYNNKACFRFFDSLFVRTISLCLFSFPSLFLFSLITYKMREEIFTAWINFAKWWIPLTIFLTLIAPASDGSFFPVNKGSVAFVMTALFTAVSLCVIVAMWTRKKMGK